MCMTARTATRSRSAARMMRCAWLHGYSAHLSPRGSHFRIFIQPAAARMACQEADGGKLAVDRFILRRGLACSPVACGLQDVHVSVLTGICVRSSADACRAQ